ncbi:MAG: ribosomal subunit interface protein [Dehalococcoidia bacterium]|nr:MAG: ribosomal subunit interface protein [Dehalococcoidia bacterium]
MYIQINTDNNIEGSESLIDLISGKVESALSRFSDHVTQVNVHLSDENSDKKVGRDAMRCMIEVRVEGLQPIAVTHQAVTLVQAVDGAAAKLAGLIESTLGRLRDKKGRRRANLTPPEPNLREDL